MYNEVVLNIYSEWVLEGGEHMVDGCAIHLNEVRGARPGHRWSATVPPSEALWGYYEEASVVGRDKDSALIKVVRLKWDESNGLFTQEEERKYKVYLDSGHVASWHWDD